MFKSSEIAGSGGRTDGTDETDRTFGIDGIDGKIAKDPMQSLSPGLLALFLIQAFS